MTAILGKKGQDTSVQTGMIAAGIVFAGIVVLSLLGKTVQDLNGETFEKNYVSRDIALIMDAIYASPGDIEYAYIMKDYKYVIEIKGGLVYAKKSPAEKDGLAGIYPYLSPKKADPLSLRIIPNKAAKTAKVIVGNKAGKVYFRAENAQVENAAFA